MFLRNLCTVQWTNYLVDVVLVLVLLGYVIYCAKRGFIDCFLGFFSTIIALLAAIFLAKAVVDLTGGLFGLRKVLDKTFTDAFMKVKGFDSQLVGEGTGEALKTKNVPAILVQLVLKMTKSAQEGTVLAVALGDVTSVLATTIIGGAAIFIAVKLLLCLAKGILGKIADKLEIVGMANTILGAVVGVFGFTLLVSFILSILAVIPVQAINDMLNNSIFVGFIYKHNPIIWLIGLLF